MNVVANISRIPKVNEALISYQTTIKYSMKFTECLVYLAMTLKIPNNNMDSCGRFDVHCGL